MPEQTFEQAVRESRVFYRRRLAERLATAVVRSGRRVSHTLLQTPADIASYAAELADALTNRLSAIEEQELLLVPEPREWACPWCSTANLKVGHPVGMSCPNLTTRKTE